MDKQLKNAGAIVLLTRPRGYFGLGRDIFTIDGRVPDGINAGVPGTSVAVMTFPAAPQKSVPASLNDEHLTVRTFPAADNQVVYAEFHY